MTHLYQVETQYLLHFEHVIQPIYSTDYGVTIPAYTTSKVYLYDLRFKKL